MRNDRIFWHVSGHYVTCWFVGGGYWCKCGAWKCPEAVR